MNLRALAAIVALALPGCVQFTAESRRADGQLVRVQLTQFLSQTASQSYAGPVGRYDAGKSDQTRLFESAAKAASSGAIRALK